MDALLESLSSVSLLLLPVLGAAVLIVLLILLIRVFDLLKKVDKTVAHVDETLMKIDGPINTVVNVSKTIDFVNSAAENAAKTIAVTAAKNISVIIDWLKQLLNKHNETAEVSDIEETTEEELGL